MVIWEEAIPDEHIKYNPFVMTSLVDCLSRHGRYGEVKQLILEYETRNCTKHLPMWMTYLRGCCNNTNIKMCEQIHLEMQRRFNDKEMKAASILLSNVYGALSNFNRKEEIRNAQMFQ